MSRRLQTGGSQGEPLRTSVIPYFHPGVRAVELLAKNVYGVRLLPAFERDEANMPKSPLSVRAYRNHAAIDPESGKPTFTDWYYSLKLYKFLGEGKRGFLSPLIMERTDQRGVDPVYDCYHLARNSKDSHPEWYALTEKAEGEKNAVLERYRIFCAMNALMEIEGSLVNRLVFVTQASMEHLKEQLNRLCARADQPNDPEWPDFMLGDVTGLMHGLWGTVQRGRFNKIMETSLFTFSRSVDRLVNVNKYPIDPNTGVGQEVLAGRYDIGDLEKVTRVATAEEMLDYIVNDGFLPMDLIREACSPFWDVPEPRARHTSAPRAYVDKPESASGGGGFVKKTTTATAPTTTPAPKTSVQESRTFWVLLPSGQTSAQPIPEMILRKMVEQHGKELMVMRVGENEWKASSAFGISAPEVLMPPSPPEAPKPPAATRIVAPGVALPNAGVPVMQPPAPVQLTPPAPPTTVQMVQKDLTPPPPPPAVQKMMAPIPQQPPAPPTTVRMEQKTEDKPQNAEPLTPEEQAEFEELEKKWIAASLGNSPIDADTVQRYSALSDRATAFMQKQG